MTTIQIAPPSIEGARWVAPENFDAIRSIQATIDGVLMTVPDDPANSHRCIIAEWEAAGGVISPYVEPVPVARESFLARELLEQLTSADYAAIQSAIAANADLGLLWSSLLAQGGAPISVGSERFQAGWTGLAGALGADRATAIYTALNLAPQN